MVMFLNLRKHCLGKGLDGVEEEDQTRDGLPRVLPRLLPKTRFHALPLADAYVTPLNYGAGERN